MRIAVIGTTEFTLNCAQTIINNKYLVCVLVSLTKEKLPNNSADIKRFALLNKIPYFETDDINSKRFSSYLKELEVDFIFSTWPHLISKNIIDIPKYGVIGTHPTPLPRNKGRHPLHWMVALGLRNSAVSFFKMDEDIDSGNILIQEPFLIGETINSANENMISAGERGLKKLLKSFNNKYTGTKQDVNKGNSLRKRDIHDITIDPRMGSNVIIKIVNSFCYPYPLARLYFKKNSYLNIAQVNVLSIEELDKNWEDYEHGYIFKAEKDSIYMRVDDSVINMKINCINLDTSLLHNNKVHPPSYYFNLEL